MERGDTALFEQLVRLYGTVERAMVTFASRDIGTVETSVEYRRSIAAPIGQTGSDVFALLPEGVKALFTDEHLRFVFVAPCSLTVNMPFELLRLPRENSTGWSFLGLHQMMPRVHGLTELVRLLRAQPRAETTRSAVVVGNPLHERCQPLPFAKAAADRVAQQLLASDYSLRPNGKVILDENATTDAVLGTLADGAPRLWIQMGHGGRARTDDLPDVGEFLALAGTGRLFAHQVARLDLSEAIVHHDCCIAGTTRGRGGGRFDGHPTAAMSAGAACVLSSVHPIWDDTAAEFSLRLYRKMLQSMEPLCVGSSLLETRREVAAINEDNPLIWATTILWGNPWAQLLPSPR